MPEKICSYCLLDLDHAIVFRERCIQSNDLFLLGNSNETLSKPQAVLHFENNSKYRSDDPLANDDTYIRQDDEEIKPTFIRNLPYKIVPASNAFRRTSISEIESSKSLYSYKSASRIRDKRRRLSTTYSCDPCNRHFNDKTSLDRHLKRHFHDKTNENVTFGDSSLLLTDHAVGTGNTLGVSPTIHSSRRVPEISLQTHQSPRCTTSDSSSDEMNWPQVHYRSNKKIIKLRSYFCEQCGRHFNDKANLNRHLQRHLGVKKFECQECGHKDYSQHLINLHTRIQHHGEKPYACKYCGNRFANSMARLRHQRSQMLKSYCSISLS